jgi:hypothetical protein
MTKPTISRPKDRSLGAFKAWVTEIADRLVGKGKGGDISEAEWEKAWKEFWHEEKDTAD